uniref:Uncharacterized protein n=1 Tax=Haemonchus contortus TaxID=6289 RepID=W6N8Y8_HAECO
MLKNGTSPDRCQIEVVTVLPLHRRDVTYPIDSRSNRGSRVGLPFTIRPLVKVADLSVRGRESATPVKERFDQGSRTSLSTMRNPPQSSQLQLDEVLLINQL